MDTLSLRINDQPISLTEIFSQMGLFRKLQPFLQEFVSQHVILQEINNRDDITVDSSVLMQAIMDFRLKQGLAGQDKFNEWLSKENLNSTTFQQRVMLELKVKKLQESIAQPNLQSYFEGHKQELEQLELSSILVSNESTAHEIKEQVTATQDLQKLVNEYASPQNGIIVQTGKQQAQRRSLPKELQTQCTSASPGQVVGPINLKGTWCLFRLEAIIPAELDDRTKEQIQGQLFGEWLSEKLNTVKISLEQDKGTNSQPPPK